MVYPFASLSEAERREPEEQGEVEQEEEVGVDKEGKRWIRYDLRDDSSTGLSVRLRFYDYHIVS